MGKKKIVFCVPIVWGIRNVIHSGLAATLADEYDIYYAVPENGVEHLKGLGINSGNIIALPKVNFSRKYKFLSILLLYSYETLYPMADNQVYKTLIRGEVEKTFNYKLKILPIKLLSIFFRSKPALNFLKKKETAQFIREIPANFKKKIDDLNPDLTISTTVVVGIEFLFTRYIQSQGKKSITHVLSFDNLTSRGYIPIEHFDHYMVWNETMSKELDHYYGINGDKVSLTGTPQFDFHVRDEFRWTKEKLYRQLGLNTDKPYFLYCANHTQLSPNEPELLDYIVENCKNTPELKDFQWVIRPHPLDDYSRWDDIVAKHDNVIFSIPWVNNSSLFACPSREEICLLSNSLIHSTAVFNIGSTISIDASVCDKPIISIGFHPNPDTIDSKSNLDLHSSHHYKPIMKTNATTLVKNIDELKNELHTILNNPNHKQAERANLVNIFTAVKDGYSIHKIADKIRTYA